MGYFRSGVGAAFLLFLLSGCGRKVPVDLPPGMELKYSVSVERIQSDPNPQPMLDLREMVSVWTGPQEADGQWTDARLVMQYGMLGQEETWGGNDRIFWGRGFLSDKERAFRLDFWPQFPDVTFPWWTALPRSRKEAERGWSTPGKRDGMTYSYRLADKTAWADRHWVVERETVYEPWKAVGREERARFVFDRDKGCLSEIELRQTYAQGFWKEYRIVARLDGLRSLSDAERIRHGRDAEACLAVMAKFDQATHHDNGANGDQVRAEIAAFDDAAQGFSQGDVSPEYRHDADWLLRVTSNPKGREDIAAKAEERARINGTGVNLPSPDWTWPDLAGTPHALQEYRGKVVLLDFWANSCVPCLMAMPKLQRLAEEMQGKPVAILGANTSDGPAEAGAMARKLGISYPQLLARPGNPYVFEGIPTTILIDAQGVVRFRWTGYEPGLGTRSRPGSKSC